MPDRDTLTNLNLTYQKDKLLDIWRVLVGLVTIFKRMVTRRPRVPVMMQLKTVECGTACLAMILNYYGKKISVAKCRDICGTGRDGTSAQSIARAARDSGLRVKAYSVEIKDFKYIPLPAVAHWSFNHFIVIEEWGINKVKVIDPACGRRTLSIQEFRRSFTGIVLTFEPGEMFTPQEMANKPENFGLRYYLSMMSLPKIKYVLGQIVFCSLIFQFFGLSLPLFTKILVDYLLPQQQSTLMWVLALGIFIIVLAQAATTYIRHLLLIYLRGRLDSHLICNFFEHLLTLPFAFFQQRTSGDLLLRLSSNNTIRETLTNQTMSVLLDCLFILTYILVIFSYTPQFALVVLGIGIVQILIPVLTRRRLHELTQEDVTAKAVEQSYLVEALNGISMIKASGSEDKVFDHWSNLFNKQLNASIKKSHLAAVSDTLMTAIRTATPLIMLWLGAMSVMKGEITIGTMLSLNVLAAGFLNPLTALVGNCQQLYLIKAHLDRIADVMNEESEQKVTDISTVHDIKGHIEVRNLNFKYDKHAPYVLHDISFVAGIGQKIAIVGATGSGKSTLAMLLLGLYQVEEGDILYDGNSLRALNFRRLRSRIGVVLQEPHLFTGTIRQNIHLNRPEASLDEIFEVAKIANIHDEISEMPMGYETFISEGGGKLSGGQRQRLEIARALLHKPSILILDEATSHLDTITESKVDNYLNALNCTRIVIAHRLSTVRNADLILVMDKGTIVERGRHEELLDKGGIYSMLIESQALINDKTILNDLEMV
jgi:ATP-binding cassette, subfamily B, bacterial